MGNRACRITQSNLRFRYDECTGEHCRMTSLLDGRILYVFLGAVFSKQYSINAIGPLNFPMPPKYL